MKKYLLLLFLVNVTYLFSQNGMTGVLQIVLTLLPEVPEYLLLILMELVLNILDW